MENLKARLEAAKAAKKAIEDARAKRAEEQALENEVLRLEREAKEAVAKETAELEIGKEGIHWTAVETVLGVVLVKRAHPATFQRFQDEGKFNSEAIDKLGRPSVFYPDHATYDAMTEELPALPTLVADAVSVLAGVRSKEQSKK